MLKLELSPIRLPTLHSGSSPPSKCTRTFNFREKCKRAFKIYGIGPLASKQASTYVTNTLPQCSPASVGLAQARPNNHGLRTRGAKCGCRLETSKLRLAEWTKTMHDHAVARFCVVFTVVLASEPYCRGNPKHLVWIITPAFDLFYSADLSNLEELQDEGIYICFFALGQTLLQEPKNVTVFEGMDAFFPCYYHGTSGIPTWRIANHEFATSALPPRYFYNGSGLVVSNVDLSLNMTSYSCFFIVYGTEGQFVDIESTTGYLYISGLHILSSM